MEIISYTKDGKLNPYSGIVESALKNGGNYSGEGFTATASGGKYTIDFGANGTEEGTYIRKYWAVIGESESQFGPYESAVHKCDTAFHAIEHYHAQKEAQEWAKANNHALNVRLSDFDWANQKESERKRQEETTAYLEGREQYLYCYNHFDAPGVLVVKPRYKFIEIREIWLAE